MTPNKLCELPLCSYIIIRLFVQFKLRIGEIQKIALYKFIITVLITPTVFKDSILVTGLMKVYQYGFDN